MGNNAIKGVPAVVEHLQSLEKKTLHLLKNPIREEPAEVFGRFPLFSIDTSKE